MFQFSHPSPNSSTSQSRHRDSLLVCNIHIFLFFLKQESAKCCCKGPESKYFRLCGPYILCCNDFTLPYQYKNSHRQYINESVWLCSIKVLFTKIGSGSALGKHWSKSSAVMHGAWGQAEKSLKNVKKMFTINTNKSYPWLLSPNDSIYFFKY